jgi:choline dehydrogenase-like flavoprotein
VTDTPFDAIVIGTGFGGAVAACRLAQAGKTVCILERGRRYPLGDFPRPAKRPDSLPHTARWAWAIDHGLWDVKDLQGILAAFAAGYGGGSLVYANVHLRAPAQVFSPATGHEEDIEGWPAGYTRQALDPFYDVVAAALRVRPIPPTLSAPAPAPLRGRPLPKVDAMRRVATKLGREQWLFLPPVAIDFDKCVMCAECVAGCQFHAKNTLDLNYLAVAEAAPGVDVRTLAEVTHLKQEADATYTVTYRDHVTGGSETQVQGKSVFLCAGAVSSTDILLRSQGDVGMLGESRKQIGRRFFGNGDAISMVFDTTSGPAPTPTAGPTIATTLLYNRQPASLRATPHEWFVLQDGGYPKWLEPVLGLFRGEFWLDRNRLITGPPTTLRFDPDAAADVMRQAREMGQALLGLMDARSAFQTRSLTATLGLADILPRQIRQNLIPHLQRFAHELEAGYADPVASMTLDEVGDRIQRDHSIQGLFVPRAKKLARPYLLPSTLEILHQYFLNAPRGTVEPFTPQILWPLLVGLAGRLFLDRRPNDNALLMLGVGVDAAPGQLFLDDDGQLLASWDLAANIPFSSVQEQLMHDVAGALGGEMRLNPDFTSRQRPVTVHCLGGCAMANNSGDGVTDPNGKVWGTRALYVLDGAAIPTSLGTNPSSTIAAIAERNVRKALADPQSPIFTPTVIPLDRNVPGWPPEMTVAQIQQRLGQTPAVLDPIGNTPTTASPEPVSPAVGLTFDEVMRGFHTRGPVVNLPIRSEFQATIDDLNAFLVNPRRLATITGKVFITPAHGAAEVTYDARGTLALLRRVDTVVAVEKLFGDWLRVHGSSPKVAGSVATSAAVVGQVPDLGVAMDALLRKLVKQAHRYEMKYDLELTGPGGPLKFSGVKKIYGGRGMDVWTETTTLEVVLTDAAGTIGKGKMRVHLADFLGRQLPSFTVTGTRADDDIRIAWAFGRFFRFFFGTLRQVYLPQLETLNPFGDRTS